MKMVECLKKAKEKGFTHCRDNASSVRKIDDYIKELEEVEEWDKEFTLIAEGIFEDDGGYMGDCWVTLFKIDFYETMYDYAKEGNFTHFHSSKFKNQEYAIEGVKLYDQPDTIFTRDDVPEFEGYTHVHMGEPHLSYLKTSALDEEVYFVYQKGQVISSPFPNREKAEEWLKSRKDD